MNLIFPITSEPLSATLSFGSSRNSARLSTKPLIFPPPPTTKTALTDFPPLSSIILPAMLFVIDCTVSFTTSAISSDEILYGSPIISLNVTVSLSGLLAASSCSVLLHLRASASLKSVR